jgi:hypothetical protein
MTSSARFADNHLSSRFATRKPGRSEQSLLQKLEHRFPPAPPQGPPHEATLKPEFMSNGSLRGGASASKNENLSFPPNPKRYFISQDSTDMKLYFISRTRKSPS